MNTPSREAAQRLFDWRHRNASAAAASVIHRQVEGNAQFVHEPVNLPGLRVQGMLIGAIPHFPSLQDGCRRASGELAFHGYGLGKNEIAQGGNLRLDGDQPNINIIFQEVAPTVTEHTQVIPSDFSVHRLCGAAK